MSARVWEPRGAAAGGYICPLLASRYRASPLKTGRAVGTAQARAVDRAVPGTGPMEAGLGPGQKTGLRVGPLGFGLHAHLYRQV